MFLAVSCVVSSLITSTFRRDLLLTVLAACRLIFGCCCYEWHLFTHCRRCSPASFLKYCVTLPRGVGQTGLNATLVVYFNCLFVPPRDTWRVALLRSEYDCRSTPDADDAPSYWSIPVWALAITVRTTVLVRIPSRLSWLVQDLRSYLRRSVCTQRRRWGFSLFVFVFRVYTQCFAFFTALYMLRHIRLSVRPSVRHTTVLCQNEGTQRDAVFTIG